MYHNISYTSLKQLKKNPTENKKCEERKGGERHREYMKEAQTIMSFSDTVI